MNLHRRELMSEPVFYQYYVLSVKGGWYDRYGIVREYFKDACLFEDKEKAIAFRERYDRLNKIDCSLLQIVRVLVEDAE